MINKYKISEKTGLKNLLVTLSVIAALLLFSNLEMVARVTTIPSSLYPTQAKDSVYEKTDQLPSWKEGGTAGIYAFISKNLHYPEAAKKNGVQGSVFIRFKIEKDGSVSEAKVIRSLDPSLDKEALRVVNMMPLWNPGRMKNKAVRSYFVLPIKFQLK